MISESVPPAESLKVYVSVGCGLQTFVPFSVEIWYLTPTMRVSPAVAPVTDSVTASVVALTEFVEDRFPQLPSYRLTCARFWGTSGGQLGKLQVLFGAMLWLIVNVKLELGATILV